MAGQAKNKTLTNPFPGLRPFGLRESHLFFGREGQSDDVLKNLSKHRFVAVVGSSGSGKSSLMYCGIVPSIYGGFIQNAGTNWRLVVTRPGNQPINNLAHSLVKIEQSENNDEFEKEYRTEIFKAILKSSSLGLLDAIKQLNLAAGENILLLLDQFEELFRFKNLNSNINSINESLAYVKLILEVVNQQELPVYVILTMRSDFIGECAQYQELTQLINESHYLVPQMTRDDLRRAITGPVAVGNGIISERLVNQLLNDVGDNPDQLPILQHAMMRTWDYWVRFKQEKEPLDISHYEAIGRMEKALSEHANEAFSELTPRGQDVCEIMFKSLTERGSDNRGIRRPTKIADLAEMTQGTVDEIVSVVEKFRFRGRSFLMPPAEYKLDAETIIDISHESLMRIWDRLIIWVDEEVNSVQMYLRLSESASLFQSAKSGLWRQPDLQLAINWREKQKPNLKWAIRYAPSFERTMVFLSESENEYLAEEENKIRLQKAALRRSRIFALVLSVATIVSLSFLLYSIVQKKEADKQRVFAEIQKSEALIQRMNAEKQKRNAESQRILAENQKRVAIKQSFIADDARKIAETKTIFALVQKASADTARNFAETKRLEADRERRKADSSFKEATHQKYLAELQRMRADTLRMLSIAQSMAVKSLQISGDNNLKALVAYQAYKLNNDFNGNRHHPDIYSGIFSALNALNGGNFNVLKGHSTSIRALAAGNMGFNLFSASSDGFVFRWNLKDNKFDTIADNKVIIRSIGVSFDNRWLAVGCEKKLIQIFDLNSQKLNIPYWQFRINADFISSVAFSKDSKFLFAACSNNRILKIDIINRNYQVFEQFATKPLCLSSSKNIPLLAASFGNGKTVFWNYENGNSDSLILGQNVSIASVAVSPNGKYISTGDNLGNVLVWLVAAKKIDARLSGHHSQISDMKFSPDEKYLATTSRDGIALLWQVHNFNEQPVVCKENNSWILSVAFSPDSKTFFLGFKESKLLKLYTQSDLFADLMCAKLTRNLSQAEWNKYVGADVKYQVTCSSNPPGEDVINNNFSSNNEPLKVPYPYKVKNTIVQKTFLSNALNLHVAHSAQEDVWFSVQFVSVNEKIDVNKPALQNLKSVNYYIKNDKFFYFAGKCKSMKDAISIQKQLREMGYKDAFVIAFKNGVRVPVKEVVK